MAGLLKQFFRDLPDTLLTREYYDNFIEAASKYPQPPNSPPFLSPEKHYCHVSPLLTDTTQTEHEDDVVRRDSLHATINNLPDPNYATLRALMLHLHRVVEGSSVNRMTSQNLAIVFGPTLMGGASKGNIADSGWQCKCVDTILQNTMQIFDDD